MKYQPGQYFIPSLWYDKNCFENMKTTVTPSPFCIPQLVTFRRLHLSTKTRRLLFARLSWAWEAHARSMFFPRNDRLAIGRLILSISQSSFGFFISGVISADLRASGNLPFTKDKFTNLVLIIGRSSLTHFFSNHVGIGLREHVEVLIS